MSKSKITYDELVEQNKLLAEKTAKLEANEKRYLKTLDRLKQKEDQLITSKNKAEESTKLLLNISDNIPAFVAIVDAKTLKYKFVNSKFVSGFNKEKHEIVGAHISEIIGKEKAKFAMKYINEVRNGNATSYVNTFDLTTGKSFAKVNYVPGFNENGEVVEIIVLTHDITALKNSEEELKQAKAIIEESEKRFKALHNASFGGIAIHDKGVILDSNQGLANMTGYDSDVLIGMNGLLLIAEESRDDVMNKIINNYEKPYEAIGIKKNSVKYPLRIEARMIPYKGKMVRVTEFRDITQQKKHEQKLIEQNEKYEWLNEQLIDANKNLISAKEKAVNSEEQLKLISNNFVDGMIYQVVTLDETRRNFTYVSEAVNKLYGYTPDEVKENAELVYNRIHPDHINNLVQAEKEAIEHMSIFKTEAKVINPDGSTRWSYFVSKPRIIDGLIHWDGLEFDITDRKRLEKDLLDAKNKAEESDRLKSAFLANMSHEIRTPMNSILGFSDLLKQPDLEDNEKSRYLEFITQGGTQLLAIISDIVDVSKIDANQITLKIEKHSLNDIIDSLYNQFKVSNQNKAIDLKMKKGLTDNLSTIKTDSVRLKQIISNLIENALKFTQEGSVEFGYSKESDHYLFFVKDTGIGINKEHHDIVFDRFSQINDDFFNSGSGTGLGLSIVKGLIELLNGKIWIEPTVSKGTTFCFSLPLQ